jgi:hypothetical protein
MQQASLTMVQKVRRTNLKKLVAAMFEGNASKLGRKLKASHTYIWQLLSGHRGIGEKSAREIEKKLGMAPYTLDKKAGATHESVFTIRLGERMVTLRAVPVRSLDALDAKSSEDRLCPVEHCSPDTFAVIADNGVAETMLELSDGDVLFAEPLGKEPLVNRKLYVVRARGSNKRGRVMQARANGEGGWLFTTTAKRNDVPYGDLVVLGRVRVIQREVK